jgi:hypothetical protein
MSLLAEAIVGRLLWALLWSARWHFCIRETATDKMLGAALDGHQYGPGHAKLARVGGRHGACNCKGYPDRVGPALRKKASVLRTKPFQFYQLHPVQEKTRFATLTELHHN